MPCQPEPREQDLRSPSRTQGEGEDGLLGAGHAPHQEDWPAPGRPAPCRGWGGRGASQRGSRGACRGGVGSGPSTHSVPALFSEKKRSTKSPSLLGSKVEGTTTYSPGGRRKRVLTSRRLMNCSDRARDALARKKSRFRCTAGWPASCGWERGSRVCCCPRTQPRLQAPSPGQGAGEPRHGSVTHSLCDPDKSFRLSLLTCKMESITLPIAQGGGECRCYNTMKSHFPHYYLELPPHRRAPYTWHLVQCSGTAL